MTRATIQPEVLTWAVERAGLSIDTLAEKFVRVPEWLNAQSEPTLKQIEKLARYLRVPVGYLFLQTPPVETLPIPDFRTVAGKSVGRPSPELIDVVHSCQERQGWFKEYALLEGVRSLDFVGSADINASPVDVAARMREVLRFDIAERRDLSTWKEALRRFIDQVDSAGILVMVNGIVQNNTHRKLRPQEFRGFTLADAVAPLIFVNGADSKAAQMFTLAHELAHVWLGESGVSDATPNMSSDSRVERWCNEVAAEMLAPLSMVKSELRANEPLNEVVSRLARHFKVSTLVVLRRLLDAGSLAKPAFVVAYQAELERIAEVQSGSGGDFYRTTISRTGKRFLRALVQSTLEGQTLYRDAYRMLGITKAETFHEIGKSLRFSV